MKPFARSYRQKVNPLWLLSLPLLTLWGCIEYVDPKHIPHVESKLVIQSHITPGDSIRVSVWESVPLRYNQPIRVDNRSGWEDPIPPSIEATVTIRCEGTGQEALIPLDSLAKIYRLPPEAFALQPGQTYRLLVADHKGRSVQAVTTVPIAERFGVTIQNIRNASTGYETTIEVLGRVFDNPDRMDFYSVEATLKSDTICYWAPIWIDDTNPIDSIWQCYVNICSSSGVAFSDRQRTGDSIGFRLQFWCSRLEEFDHLIVTTTLNDEHSYLFERSLERFWESEWNPFAESAPLHTNITGGLGVFGSYLKLVDSIGVTPLEATSPR